MNADTKEIVVEDEEFTAVSTAVDAPLEVEATEEKTEKFSISDEELKDYVSKKVQKRFDTLTWEKNEERRGKEAAEGLRNQAVEFARQQVQRSENYEQIINDGEAFVIKQIKGRVALAFDQAKDAYRKATDEGDTDAVVEAQEKLIKAGLEQQEIANKEVEYQGRAQQFATQQHYRQQVAAQQLTAPPPAPIVPKPSDKAMEWGKANSWFTDNMHPEMESLAYGIDKRLLNEGVQRDSDEYFQEIDKGMRQRFPDYEGFKDTTPSTVVAPVSRSNGGRTSKVKLSATEIALADELNVSYEQYATFKLKGELASKR